MIVDIYLFISSDLFEARHFKQVNEVSSSDTTQNFEWEKERVGGGGDEQQRSMFSFLSAKIYNNRAKHGLTDNKSTSLL